MRDEADGRDIIGRVFESAARTGRFGRKVVASSDFVVLETASMMGFEVLKMNVTDSGDRTSFLPDGSMRALAEIVPGTDSGGVMILDVRNPLLNSEILDCAAARFYENGKKNLVSVTTPTDHPIQFSRYYRISEISVVHMFEDVEGQADIGETIGLPPEATSGYRITRPFAFNWVADEIVASRLSRIFDTGNEGYEPLPVDVLSTEQMTTRGVLRVFDSPETARLMVAGERLYSAAAGFVVSGVVYDGVSDKTAGVILDDKVTGKTSIRLFRTLDIPSAIAVINWMEDDVPKSERIDWKTPVHEIVLNEFNGRVDTALCCIIETVNQSGEYHFRLPAEIGGELWHVDGSDQVATVGAGHRVAGRQDFPDLYVRDGSFVILGRESLNANESVEFGFYELKRNESIRIETWLDMMKYRAIVGMADK
jgi:CMP-N-acetylneuraminic acid synthetase